MTSTCFLRVAANEGGEQSPVLTVVFGEALKSLNLAEEAEECFGGELVGEIHRARGIVPFQRGQVIGAHNVSFDTVAGKARLNRDSTGYLKQGLAGINRTVAGADPERSQGLQNKQVLISLFPWLDPRLRTSTSRLGKDRDSPPTGSVHSLPECLSIAAALFYFR